MPGRLSELIVASETVNGGSLTADPGESFDVNVAGNGAGNSIGQYRLTSVARTGDTPLTPGENPAPGGAYTGTQSFSMTFTVTANALFSVIQQLLQAAWAAFTNGGNGSAVVTITSFAWSVGNTVCDITFEVEPPNPGTGLTVNTSSAFVSGSPTFFNPELVKFECHPNVGAPGTDDFDIVLQWFPTAGGFESVRTYTFPVRWNERNFVDSDIIVEWFLSSAHRSAGTPIQHTGPVYSPSGGVPPYVSDPTGSLPTEIMTVYGRWRRVTGGSNTNFDLQFSDTRPPE